MKTYKNESTIILDFDKLKYKDSQSLLASEEFTKLLKLYLDDLKTSSLYLHKMLVTYNGDDIIGNLQFILRKLNVFKYDELDDVNLDKQILIRVIDGIYNFYKSHNRYITASVSSSSLYNSFIDLGEDFTKLVLTTYRTLLENVKGRKDFVYRQLQAGYNASILTRTIDNNLPEMYSKLNDFKFIETLVLETPLILHSKSNTRKGSFTETDVNPITYFNDSSEDFFVYPAKVGELLCFIYFHKDFIGNAISLSNLFEFANQEECQRKPDLICLFGVENDKNETVFHYDDENDIYIGSITHADHVDYFGYLKKMCLTLHNLMMMKRSSLPIHGAFINVYLKDGKKKGIMLMGDSGAGKSETIEALQNYAKDEIANIDIIFDDMGIIKIENYKCYGYGTEIGAFIRLDDLDEGTPYKDMDRSIFMNTDKNNARVVLPVASYELITSPHEIDMFLYANNYDDKFGISKFDSYEDMKNTFIDGKRMALGTTDEIGITTTYFANPFGPMQKQDVCNPLIDNTFKCLERNNIYIGEAYTHLGFKKDGSDGLEAVSKEILKFIKG